MIPVYIFLLTIFNISGSRRLSHIIKMLIPETYMPDQVIRDVLKLWITKKPGKETIKTIFHWLIGLTEHKLTESNVIDLYYDFYFQQIKDNVCLLVL